MASVYLALKFHQDHRNRYLVDRIARAFEVWGVETVCFARDFEHWGDTAYRPDQLMKAALGAIDDCSAVVVEFSEKGVGIGIEAGYATARGIPVFVIHPPDVAVSATLQGVAREVIPYADADSLAGVARRIAESLGD